MGKTVRTAGRRAAAAAPAPAPQATWAIVTFASGSPRGAGFFLDSFVTGTQADADTEARAAQEGNAGLGYSNSFAAPLRQGFRRLTERPARPMDVWLYRRNANGDMEYMVKVTRAAADGAPAAAPEESEEWQAILLAAGWLPPAAAARAARGK